MIGGKKKVPVDYRAKAHAELDKWIDDQDVSKGSYIMPNLTKENPYDLWLGSLAQVMVNALLQSRKVRREQLMTEHKEILPAGTKIQFPTGWIWEVGENNELTYPPTGQKSTLLRYSRKDYKVIK